MSTPVNPPSRPSSPAPMYRRQPLRIACVQYDVKAGLSGTLLGRVEENAAKVNSMTASLEPGSLDLLVLPEMCLSGYMFSSATAILPYLEPARIGPTCLLARSLARRLRCHVIAGYPEALGTAPVDTDTDEKIGQPSSSAAEGEASTSSATAAATATSTGGPSTSSLDLEDQGSDAGPASMKELEGEGTGVGYNSAVVVGPQGDVLGNYRKTFRFDTDKSWAREGEGFRHFDLPEPLGRTAVGICMDINPKDFIAPWDAFELATYCRNQSVDTLVLPMNWLEPPSEPPEETPPPDPHAPSESNLNYWAARLTPLHDPTPGYFSPAPVERAEPTPGKEVVFVGCNRVGTEEGTTFVGTSCVMTVSSEPRRIELVEVCNISEERVLLATVA